MTTERRARLRVKAGWDEFLAAIDEAVEQGALKPDALLLLGTGVMQVGIALRVTAMTFGATVPDDDDDSEDEDDDG